MNFRTVKTIFKKEMLDTVRDKRTLVMMIGVPVLLYPVLLIVGMQGALIQHATLEETVSKISLDTAEPDIVRAWLDDIEMIEIVETSTATEDLNAGTLDAVIRIADPIADNLAAGKSIKVDIQYDSTEFTSVDAAGRLRSGLEKDSEALLDTRLADLNLGRDYILPLQIDREDMAPPAKTTGNLLGTILPVLMVVMLALGAFYPAVDVTAGEKERGTFETLLSTPTTKLEIVTGKFVTVFLLAMITGLLNLGSMAATFVFMAQQLKPVLGDAVQFDIQFPPSAIIAFLFIMIPLAFFISAVMMAIAVMARSFKEAQNYVTPFFVIITMPALFASMPGVKLTGVTQFIPIANVILLFRDMMTGKAAFESTFAVFLTTAVFAALALQFAAWLFQREEVVLSEEKGFPLTWRRSEFRYRESLSPSMSVGCYLLLLITLFYGGSFLNYFSFFSGIFITQWFLLLAPILFFLWYVKIDLRKALNLYPVSLAKLAISLLIGVSTILLVMHLGSLLNKVLPMPEAFEQLMKELFEGSSENLSGILLLLFLIAFSPAICEELLFRGAILTGLRSRLKPWAVIITVGILFGIFHISPFRIPVTALLGMMLAYLTIRTGSIIPAMIVHFINNAFAILAGTQYLPDLVDKVLKIEELENRGVPIPVLVVATFGLITGIVLMERQRRTPKATPQIE